MNIIGRMAIYNAVFDRIVFDRMTRTPRHVPRRVAQHLTQQIRQHLPSPLSTRTPS